MNRTFSRIWLVVVALLGSTAMVSGAAWEWGNESGSASYKVLKIAPTPRQAALAGAGLANPGSASEAVWNPMAGSWSKNGSISLNQVRLSERLNANWNSLQLVEPFAGLHLNAGANYLHVQELEERDELTGEATGHFGAHVWRGRLGLSSGLGPFTWGLQGSYTSFALAEYDSRAILADAVLGCALFKDLRIAAGVFHLGWVDAFDTSREMAPTTLQAGISYELPWKTSLTWMLHGDLRRSQDGLREYLFGLESTYRDFLILRMGGRVDSETRATVHGGLGLMLAGLEASYAYTANPYLQGSHSFGLGYHF